MSQLLFRFAVYLVVLFLVAVVVVGQHHATAQATVRAAARRTLRWIVWTAILLALIVSIEVLFIGW